MQRSLRARGPLVAEGRDLGTVVFPDAEVKIAAADVDGCALRHWVFNAIDAGDASAVEHVDDLHRPSQVRFGLVDVPLLCAQEMDIDGALERVVRILVHAELDRPRREIQHVYLRGAEVLRQDLVQ